MKKILTIITAFLSVTTGITIRAEEATLKGILADKFYIGTALNPWQVSGHDSLTTTIVTRHFNAIVAENCMKSMYLQPHEGEFRFQQADEFVAFGEQHDMHITGHCLIWHSQLPHWFCIDEQGRNASPEVLRQRMKSHISTVVGRYKGRVKGWDVVNEAIMEDGSYRKSKFYEILGEEFIPLAFQYAHEADPEAELYYNDYNMFYPGKQEAVCRLVKQLKERGLRIDAVGMQGHIDLHHPTLETFEASINAFAETGVKVMITEFDMSVLPSPWQSANLSDTVSYEQRMNPYTEGLPDSVSVQWNTRMGEFMRLFIRRADDITRVTAWGVTDGNSWKNNFPIRGRTDYPLFFDRSYRPKPFLEELLKTHHPDENFHIYLCLGQSNMEGCGSIEAQDTIGISDRFMMMAAMDMPKMGRKRGKWYKAVPPLTVPYGGLSPADYFGRTLLENLPEEGKVGIINVAVGGCKIELFDEDVCSEYLKNQPDWLKQKARDYDNHPYQRLISLARKAQQQGVIKGILLHQGESNTGDREWPLKVKKLYERILTDLELKAEEVPLLAGEVVHATQGGACASMNEIIATLPEVIPTAHVISSDGCPSVSDKLHFTSEGYRMLGRRYAHTLLCHDYRRHEGTYRNPILYADVPDMSVCFDGTYYYMVSTTMHLMPGAPIMRSADMQHWETVSYLFPRIDDGDRYDLLGGTTYGQGQWASSIRYYEGRFYVWFSANGHPWRGFVYTTEDPTGEWTLHARPPHYHDGSILFDDDGRVYLFHGTGQLTEFAPDLSGPLTGGTDMCIFERDANERGLLEGSSAFKHEGKYYLMMISMDWGIPGRIRREVCYRADHITGPYEKKVILETPFEEYGGVGQGCIVQGHGDRWHALIFQDRDGVGRVPCLMPCIWIDGWPILGDEHGRIPNDTTLTYTTMQGICGSDDFEDRELSLYWQWNHNPIDEAWSLTVRCGALRLTTARVVDNLIVAPNTLTQRMVGPQCSGTVHLDLRHMRNGDRAGLAAFNGDSGVLTIEQENGKKTLVVSEQRSRFDEGRRIVGVDTIELTRIPLKHSKVYLRIDGTFGKPCDLATFSYSTDGKHFISLGHPVRMSFDYRRMFMGSKFAIFNYATRETGGYIDVLDFKYNSPS